ncbi:MAG: autotransporter assembly complex protein TamA [Steroidobacteraceae bacterium]
MIGAPSIPSTLALARRYAGILLAAALVLCPPLARAARPQPYEVTIASTGQDSIDDTLAATSQLEQLRNSAPVDPFGLIARARGDVDRLRTVLESFGYYQGAVTLTINGLGLDAARLGPTLEALPKGAAAEVAIAVTLGPLYRIGRIDLEGALPPGTRAALGLAPEAPAVASEVLAAGNRLQTALEDRGYAFAKVAAPVAYERPQTHTLDLTFHVTAGPQVRVGDIRFEGLKHTRAAFLRQHLRLATGEAYDAAKVEQARKALLALGVFSTVTVELGSAPDRLGRVPITFRVTESLRRTFGVNAAYSTDLGGSGGITWSDRNLLGKAERLDFNASIINLGGTATSGLGYDTGIKLILPDIGQRGDSLQFALSGLKQSLLAYDQRAESAGVTFSRRFSSIWTANFGIAGERETDVQEGISRNYTLLSLPISIIYDSTDLGSPLEDPTHGTRAALNLTPTLSLGSVDATFYVIQGSLSHYFDLEGLLGTAPGRTVLAIRAMSGVALGASEFSLPPDQRFYAGGSGTVRGYRYQSVGPQFPDTGYPVGGTTIEAVNVELRQRIGRHFGAVLFADGGGVTEGLDPFAASWHCSEAHASATAVLPKTASVSCIGVGAGVRYYTPIGPIRLDVAVPTVRRENDDRFEIYIGIGQAF